MASSNPPRSVAQPVVARGEGQVDQRGPSVPPHGRFGQDQKASTRSRGPFVMEHASVWMFWTGPNVPQEFKDAGTLPKVAGTPSGQSRALSGGPGARPDGV